MKRYTIMILAVIAILVAMAGSAIPQSSIFTGIRYDTPEKSYQGTVGAFIPIGGPIYSLSYLEGGFSAGKSASVTEDICALASVTSQLKVGVLAGPGVDWLSAPPGDPVAYLQGSVGLLASYDLGLKSESFPYKSGIWVAWKQKFDFNEGNRLYSGNTFGAGIWISLKS